MQSHPMSCGFLFHHDSPTNLSPFLVIPPESVTLIYYFNDLNFHYLEKLSLGCPLFTFQRSQIHIAGEQHLHISGVPTGVPIRNCWSKQQEVQCRMSPGNLTLFCEVKIINAEINSFVSILWDLQR